VEGTGDSLRSGDDDAGQVLEEFADVDVGEVFWFVELAVFIKVIEAAVLVDADMGPLDGTLSDGAGKDDADPPSGTGWLHVPSISAHCPFTLVAQ
jgi:hypothetical protein